MRLLIGLVVVWAAVACGAEIPSVRWDVETSSPKAYALTLYRGESVMLQPRYLSYGEPLDLSGAQSVEMQYRFSGMGPGQFYRVTGSIMAESTGRVSVTWTPSNEVDSVSVMYRIVVATSTNGNIVRAFGVAELVGSGWGQPEPSAELIMGVVDWDTLEHRNLESAPFLRTETLPPYPVVVAGTGGVIVVATTNSGNVEYSVSVGEVNISGYATTGELAQVYEAVTQKQDAVTAATDAELSEAISTRSATNHTHAALAGTGAVAQVASDLSNHQGDLQAHILTNSITVTVGPTGDYSSMTDALNYLSRFRPVHGVRGTVELQEDWTNLTDQVVLQNVDLGWVTISHEISNTNHVICNPTDEFSLDDDGNMWTFWATNATMPTLNVTLYGYTNQTCGVWLHNSRLVIAPGAGIYANSPVLATGASTLIADGAVLDTDINVNNYGLESYDTSRATLLGTTITNCYSGVLSAGGSVIVIGDTGTESVVPVGYVGTVLEGGIISVIEDGVTNRTWSVTPNEVTGNGVIYDPNM